MSSWLTIDPQSDFSLQNLPYGIVSHVGSDGKRVCASRIGDYAIDLSVLEAAGLFKDALNGEQKYFDQPTLNSFAALPSKPRSAVRRTLQSLLSDSAVLRDDKELQKRAVIDISSIKTHLPFRITDYVDYSVFPAHGLGAGRAIFGPDTPLPPTWNTFPMAYNGRAGTVSIEEEIIRPQGQTRAFSAKREHEVGPSKALDWEFEIGAFVGEPTAPGTVLTPASAESHIFGFVILNDWSARDVQAFEMTPLGPFNGKSFATTISPWVIVPEALAPYKAGKPPMLKGTPYEQAEFLREADGAKTNYEIACSTTLRLHSDPSTAHPISKASFSQAFWSFPQLFTSQSYSGAPLLTGDLLGSGTISNEGPQAQGCMLEMSKGGKEPLKVGGEERRWIEDGDELVFHARAGEEGKYVGFGELRGKVKPVTELKTV